jgi:hypothetical protein
VRGQTCSSFFLILASSRFRSKSFKLKKAETNKKQVRERGGGREMKREEFGPAICLPSRSLGRPTVSQYVLPPAVENAPVFALNVAAYPLEASPEMDPSEAIGFGGVTMTGSMKPSGSSH